MITIHKYKLAVTERQTLQLPEGAEILSVQTQRGEACLWAMVDTQVVTEPRVIEIFGTGYPIHQDMGVSREFLNTFQIEELGLVFHAFERTGV